MRLPRIVAVLALVACSDEDAGKPSTRELVVDFSVEQPDDAGPTRYEAKFLSAGRASSLDDGDEVRVTSDAAPPGALVGDDNPLGEIYALERDDPPMKEVMFILLRTTGGNAPSSKTSIPPPLAGFVPASGTSIAYGDGNPRVKLTWTDAQPDATVNFVSHACDHADDHAWSRPLPDKGALELSTKELVVDGVPTAPTCLRVMVRRGVRGTLDPSITMPGSMITGYVTHTATVSIVP